jgi:hypothetical protein
MEFFEPNTGASQLFRMGGPGHLALVGLMLALLAAMIGLRGHLWRLRRSRGFMAGTAAFVLASEAVASGLQFVYPFPYSWERIPLHLCASLKIAVALLVLFERYDLLKPVSTWAIGAGFISFANLNLNGESFGNFMFWHYLWGHLYLLLTPVLLFLAGDIRLEHRAHAAPGGPVPVGRGVFFANWALDAKLDVHRPPHTTRRCRSSTSASWSVPCNYVSYVLVALVCSTWSTRCSGPARGGSARPPRPGLPRRPGGRGRGGRGSGGAALAERRTSGPRRQGRQGPKKVSAGEVGGWISRSR